MTQRSIEWYFDFISPFTYLAHEQLDRLPADVELIYRPVLFAGLLGHWQTKGPEEVTAHRTFTYRYCHWLAGNLDIPFRMPRAHPFNPLPALRLSIALQNKPQAVARIFHFIWREGRLPEDERPWQALIDSFEIPDLRERLEADDTKQRLRENTQTAISQGVFGVPTFRVDGQLFWGQDGLPFLSDYLENPSLLEEAEMVRVSTLPAAVQRQ